MFPPIPWAMVNVDGNFLTEITALAAILPILGIGFGFFIYRITIGPAAMAAWTAKRKKAPTLWHMGRDGIFKLWPIKRSFGGVWHTSNIDVIPDERSVKSLQGGTPIGIASTNAAATLDTEWVYNTNRFTDAFSKERLIGNDKIPKMSASMASNYLDSLKFRASEIQSVLDTVNRLDRGMISIEDAVLASMAQRGFSPDDAFAKNKIMAELKGAIESQGVAYRAELEKIRAAKSIWFIEDNWVIDWEAKSNTKTTSLKKRPPTFSAKGIMALAPIRMGDFQAFLQTGANLDDLTTALRNSTMAALLENTMKKGETFRWVSLGVFIFIVMLSIYIIIQGLHLT